MYKNTDSRSCSFINDEPVHTRWQIATWILLSPICFACVYVCLYRLFSIPLFFSQFDLAFLVCCLCMCVSFLFYFRTTPLPLQVLSFTGNKLLHSNTSERSVCTWLYVYANMVHLNIYSNRTVDATRIWLIWDRNLCHNFKLKEWSNIQQQKQHLSMFAYSLSASIARSLARSHSPSFIRLIKSRA